MAGHGGGAWKVAYADFVTAMMAFFMVMWICAQDQKTRKAVAQYFIDPVGASVKPGKIGAVFEDVRTGAVPKSENVAMGKGRQAHTRAESSPQTKMMADWLHADGKAMNYWRGQAQRARADAPLSREVRSKDCTEEEAAVHQLAQQLQLEMKRDIPKGTSGIYQDLMFSAMNEVNWKEVAQDLLAQ